MSLPITTKTDYKGRIRISTSKGTQLDEYITEYERYYLTKLINVEVYNDIKDTDPLPQKYLDLINGVQYTDDNGDLIDYRGFKELLLRFIYAKYTADNFQTSVGGNVRSVNENSDVLTAGTQVIAAQRYNEGVDFYEGVYKFLKEHEELEQLVTSRTGTGIVTIGVDSTKYINAGSIVTIRGYDYTVISVVTDTSFDVDESAQTIPNLDPTDTVTYNPFYEFKYKYINYTGVI
jgi:hypothetical protein